MTTTQIAAMLLVANTALFVAGAVGGGKSEGVERPRWLPPLWARAAIPLWRFKPGTRNGKPVAVRVNVDVSFTYK